MKKIRRYTPLALLFLAACAAPGLQQEAGRHINAPAAIAGTIPKPVAAMPALPKPKAAPRTETFSVVVSNLAVSDLLFALGRDAKINIDIHPGVEGEITVNAINQTLPQILERISKQLNIRWSFEEDTLIVEPDTPYLKTYRIDYFNMARSVKTNISIANSVASTGSGKGSGTNSSSTDVTASSNNDFWKTLDKNLQDILLDTDKLIVRRVTEGTDKKNSTNNGQMTTEQAAVASRNAINNQDNRSSQAIAATEQKGENSLKEGKEANHVIINAETGVVMIRASKKKHEKVAEYLSQIGASARRQVMIEATVVEVALSDQYQSGVDWAAITKTGNWAAGQNLIGSNINPKGPIGLVSYNSGMFTATLSFLEQFGRTKVLSSPKVMALNNQTAIMKVVDEQVYFSIKIEEDKNDAGVVTSRTYTSELHTVPVGLVMQVTPQIAESGTITLNVRPTITNIRGYVEDPAVALVSAAGKLGIKSEVPNLQVREFDSTLKVPSGQVAVLGGLIQDTLTNDRSGLPGLSRLPVVGDLFSYRDDKVKKIELVIFLRPITIKDGGLDGEQSGLKQFMPGKDFFNKAGDHDLSAFQSGIILPKEAIIPRISTPQE